LEGKEIGLKSRIYGKRGRGLSCREVKIKKWV